jgi:hypothetical protein
MCVRFWYLVLFSVSVAIVAPGAASASELIDRNATAVTLKVGRNGQAVVGYQARGKRWNVLVWGAVNAIPPTTARPQVKFRLDYSGGWGTYHRDVWKNLRNACVAYDGPKLKWFVTGCKAPDGSYWAVQAWPRMLPNYGVRPTPAQAAKELRLSHWSGPLPELTVNLNWAYRKYHHIFGSFTYLGQPVYGFKSTPGGVPLDTFGRNLYVDTFDSAYGPGWKRENSFLMHRNTGMFCYGFYSHGSHPVGAGTRYRATIIGPGVTPDIAWEAKALEQYDQEFDLRMHAVQKEFFVGDSLCRAV